jgi:deoxyribonuclease-4
MTSKTFRFGTVGSPISTPKKPGGSVGAVLRLAELNLKALELGWVRSVRISEQACAGIKAAALEQDVYISVHAPYYINLNAGQEEGPNSRQRLADAAYYGSLAGARDIVFHPGSYFGSPADQCRRWQSSVWRTWSRSRAAAATANPGPGDHATATPVCRARWREPAIVGLPGFCPPARLRQTAR